VESGSRPELDHFERSTASGKIVRTPVMRVPKLEDRSRLPRDPRLRRASALGKFSAAAMLEALGVGRFEAVQAGDMRLGVVCTMMNGCVNYSNRFFGEVLGDPATASPILFPETVYNAPSSHLSAVARSTAPNDTLVGDGAEFFSGLELATEWLLRGDCDVCVVVSPEEADWLSAEAANYYSSRMVPSEGAAAVVLELDGAGPELVCVPDAVSYAAGPDRVRGFRELWGQLAAEDDGATLWADGRTGIERFDRAENSVPWNGPRLSLRRCLGEALGASSGLQSVAALELLRRGEVKQAVVTAVGGNEGIGGARWRA